MSVSYKIVKQCEPGIKGGGKGKYYARACNRNKLTLKQVCNIITKRTTFSSSDVVGVLYCFVDLFPELLKDGYSLDLEPLGIFSISLKSQGEQQKDDISSKSITGVQINFRPSVELKREMNDIEFVKK